MKLNRWVIASSICILLAGSLQAQQPIIQSQEYPQNYFRPPLAITPDASGTFAELRSNHFHSGTDYRTQQRVGLPLYAIADGYVSRVRVQIGGGGLALYIDHPNGYTSVYMHMHQFNSKIAAVVKAEQYKAQRFDVDIPLTAEVLPLKKGEVIGQAGNTGGSQGPHLHFEIRDSKSEEPINSQLFGTAFQFADKVPPTISGVTVYDLGEHVFSEHTHRRHLTLKDNGGGQYVLANNVVIPINGKTGFGINTIDRHSASSFRNGVYSIELLLDDTVIYTAVFERFSFSHSRAINSHIDYPYFMLKNTRVQKSFVEPNNPLTIYKKLVDNGVIDLKDEQIHKLTYRIRDLKGNTSTLNLRIQHTPTYHSAGKNLPGTTVFKYDRENSYRSDNVELTIPKDAMYDHLHFNYAQGSKPANGYSLVQHVHSRTIPLHKQYALAIKADNSLPEHLWDKALIVDAKGNSQGGSYEEGWVKTNTWYFGSFHITVDTIPPVIRAVNITNGKNLASQSKIDFKISDNLSGIQSFNGYIDGKWVLMEYDAKSNSLWHTFESTLPKGQHRFKLEVKDWKDNISTFEAGFVR